MSTTPLHPSKAADTATFDRVESQVRSYCRSFPRKFGRAENATIFDVDGRAHIDFLAGCSSLNYGHNDPDMRAALVDYITEGGIAHGLDMHTDAKERFLATFEEKILKPRGMDYRLMFTGPTGANAVEAALKLARKVTGRHKTVAFTHGFHGVTMGALASTANSYHRGGASSELAGVDRAPYDGYFGDGIDAADMLAQMLDDPSSGFDKPAAILVEPVQGEGGLNVASAEWMRKLEAIARKHGALLIVDDIQAGCGRTGTFFSFEEMGISPDIVTLAKSLSGMGLPFAMVMIKPEHDIFGPAEHNGTFRGNNHAFVTARVAIEKFWSDDAFQKEVQAKGDHLAARLETIADAHGFSTKGRGMMRGIDAGDGETAGKVCRACFEEGLIIETSGAHDEVVKVLCPLTIPRAQLDAGLDIVERAFAAVCGKGEARDAAE
ncbi:diaminobutyrate--2-oxoglutarate transaminase [Futiania mangrovi]|uniref:Diaminobutyrate--2-oxoglutarate transaminase n=1 Tax=Futiania mangrovi TaxID=2959716 RepID=A0A9J6PJW6_9PROT|nr:diaminobutyrate--2-oxoglutarate transaminase [Futiania mangrovii]MCP1336370.1 diaminobutyrate--2-oxoglutarate transaminase [Futiania mangrovii]